MSTFLGTASSQSTMLTLTGRPGDYCTRADINATFVLAGVDPTQVANWYPLKVGVRTTSVTSSATLTPNADTDNLYVVTALATGATISAPAGSSVNGQELILRIKDNGTPQALTWDTVWRGVGVNLPNTTIAGQTLYVRALSNITDVKWDVLIVASA